MFKSYLTMLHDNVQILLQPCSMTMFKSYLTMLHDNVQILLQPCSMTMFKSYFNHAPLQYEYRF